MAEDVRAFDIDGDWKAVALERGGWDDTVIEGGRRFMVGWREEEESAAKPAEEERGGGGRQGCRCIGGNRRTVETFQGSAVWTVSSAFEATTGAPVRDAEYPFWHENACYFDL